MRLPNRAMVLMAGALASTTAGGFFASQAVMAQDSGRVETITIRNGEQGPAGPPGPKGEKGEPGSFSCPPGFEEGRLVINHPGGQVTTYTCLEER
jgi:hypothetical protein